MLLSLVALTQWIFIPVVTSKLLPIAATSWNNSHLISCFWEVVEKYGGFGFLHASNRFEFLESSHLRPVVTMKVQGFRASSLPHLSMLIYELDDLVAFDHFLGTVYRKTTNCKVLVLNVAPFDVDEVFKLTWYHYYVDVLVMNLDGSVYSYYPISRDKCSNVHGTLAFKCGEELPSDLYNESKVEHFTGCNLRVSAIVIVPYVININDSSNPGFEIMILKEIANNLRLNIIFKEYNIPNSGGMQIDGSFTQIFKLLNEKKTDVIVGDLIANHTLYVHFHGTYPHAKIELAFFVPAAKVVSNSKYYIAVFDCYVWIIIFILIPIVSLVWYEIDCLERKCLSDYFILIIRMLLSSTNKHPHTDFLRYIFLIWAFFSFFISSFYQARFTTHLTEPNLEPQIETLEDLVESNLELGGYFSVKDVFLSDDKNMLYQTIFDRWVYCDLYNNCLRWVADGRFALFRNTRTIKWNSRWYLARNGRAKIHQLKTTSITWISMYVARGLPMYDRINEVVMMLYQTGLLDKYERDSMSNYRAFTVNKVQIPLDLSNFRAIFAIYFIGNLIALIVFYIEIKYP